MVDIIKIGIIPGDGIGRDVMRAARTVLDAIGDKYKDIGFSFRPMVVSEEAVEKTGEAFPKETRDGIAECDVVLFGAVGSPHDFVVLSGIRNGFQMYANVRPIRAPAAVKVIHPNADLVVIRENTEGLYCGKGMKEEGRYVSFREFTPKGMERIIRFAFNWARKNGRSKVTFTHKESALAHTDAVMKELFYAIAPEYPEVTADDMEIDACAMRIVMKPETLDVILAENGNGDILSDVGGGIAGGLGFSASANIGDSVAMFEPVHGSAPKYTDKNVVNPCAMLSATKMMFDYLGRQDIANNIARSINAVLEEGKVGTYDIGGSSSTSEFADAVAQKLAG
jgi:isocitrate/isopropylmalate dehydrogenase